MKQIYTTILFAGCCFCAAQAQQTRQVRVENSGTVVHESAGNEGFYRPAGVLQPQASEKKEVSELNLAQCIEAREQLVTKLGNTPDTPENAGSRKSYNETIALLDSRIKALTKPSEQ